MDDALKAKLVEAIRRALTEYVKARETTASPVATLYADDLATAALSAASTAWQAAGLKLTAREPTEAMMLASLAASTLPLRWEFAWNAAVDPLAQEEGNG